MCYTKPGPKCAKHVLENIQRRDTAYDPVTNPHVNPARLEEELDSTAGGQQILMLAMERTGNAHEKEEFSRRLESGVENWVRSMLLFDHKFYGRGRKSSAEYARRRIKENENAVLKDNALTTACEENEALYA